MKPPIAIFFLLPVLFISCTAHVDIDAEQKAIMALHNEQRRAHMEKNVQLLFKDSLADYIEVNRGIIKKPAYAESKKKFQAYFDNVDFVNWDDINPPVFSFSDDGTMATTVVDKLVITKSKQEDRLDTTYFAWLAVYKKTNGHWQLHRMASTNR